MHRVLLIIAAVLALAFAGCGGDSTSSTSDTGTTEAETSTTEEPTKEETPSEKPGEPPVEKETEISAAEQKQLKEPKVTVPSGPPPKQLVTKDLKKGFGAVADEGDEVIVHYVGLNYKSGKEFDASWNRGEPFRFELGAGMVIPGWDQGVEGMKVGGRRELVIPPELGYGTAGSPPAIPPNETLVFVIDLLAAG